MSATEIVEARVKKAKLEGAKEIRIPPAIFWEFAVENAGNCSIDPSMTEIPGEGYLCTSDAVDVYLDRSV